jgi:serine protease
MTLPLGSRRATRRKFQPEINRPQSVLRYFTVRFEASAVALFVGLSLVAAPRAARAGGPGPVAISSSDETSADIPGELVVDFKDDVEPSLVRDLFGRLAVAFSPTELEDETRIEIARVPLGRMDEVRRELESEPTIDVVEPHARVQALFVPNDPLFKEQWHLSRIGAERAWDFSTGRGVTVAVVDTGIACEKFGHFDKATDLAETRCVAGWNFVAKNAHANDDHGHGTHVAGTIAQSTNNGLGAAGVAFDARLMPVKVLSADGWGTTSDVADGIRWAADHGAQVINLSLGGPRNSRILQKAVDHAREKGVVVVAAAGNSAGPVGYPGGSAGVIGVSALDVRDQLAWFSSRGPGVDIAAPGVDVLQQTICDGGRNACELFPTFSGTSMAAPHVAGAAALLVSMGLTDPDAVEHTLARSARSLDGSARGRAKFGAGALEASNAVTRLALRRVVGRLLALALAIFFVFRRRKGEDSRGKPWNVRFLATALATGPGLLFFAPFVLPRHNDVVDFLARPVGEWDLLLSASAHGFLPLANVLWPFLLTLFAFGVPRARPVLAGLATGTAAFLGATLVQGGVYSPLGHAGLAVFAAANALACLLLARLILARQPG